MTKKRKPMVPISGLVYGEIIYWITCFSAIIVLIGTLMSFVESDSQINVEQLLSAVLSGKNLETIWLNSNLQQIPDALMYISLISSGEGLTVFGIGIGVFSIVPAVFCSAAFLWRSHNPIFTLIAILSGFISVFALIGVTLL